MRHYSVTASFAILLILALAVTAMANGATPASAPPMGVGPAVTPASAAATGPVTPQVTTQMRCFTTSQLVTMTVSEAWINSGQDYNNMNVFISKLIDESSKKRGVAIPDTREAGMELGRMIRKRAESDPNQLLYSIVDSSVRDYATIHGLPSR